MSGEKGILRNLPDEEPIFYKIVHSQRKTMSIQITRDGEVVVRCPVRMSEKRIREFVESHREWIITHYEKARERLEDIPIMTEAEVKAYREKARQVLTEKTAMWAEKMVVTYGRIAIRQQATRWGSCSGKGTLNFNWTLILVPEELQDYVVVHELAHRLQMNHSPRFWAVVEAQIPDYRERRRRLREYENQVNAQTIEMEIEHDSKMDALCQKGGFQRHGRSISYQSGDGQDHPQPRCLR